VEAGSTLTFGQQIELSWRQRVCAFWSISWQSLIALLVMVLLVGILFAADGARNHQALLVVSGNLIFLGTQAIFTRRLVQKNYFAFRIVVIRDNSEPNRRLSIREACHVWIWIFGPQLALILTVTMVVWLLGTKLSEELVRQINSWAQWLRFLLVGPFAIDLALRAQHPGFRLQAYETVR